jgi:hypothetical protein
VITGLSHLVSANIESGFKNCLPMGYGNDIRARIIFAHVFSRVLSQGTKFDVEENPTMMSRRNRLAEVGQVLRGWQIELMAFVLSL